MKTSTGFAISDEQFGEMLAALAPKKEETVVEPTTVTVDDGKYEVIIEAEGGIKVLRHGEEWRDCTGDNLVYWLAVELAEAKLKLNIKDE